MKWKQIVGKGGGKHIEIRRHHSIEGSKCREARKTGEKEAARI